ncbi:MAG: hypothetical protein J6N15_02405 [Ruminiclostridium sp.]|nr:hypothetical protein [Ruminiclostridium sp.]
MITIHHTGVSTALSGSEKICDSGFVHSSSSAIMRGTDMHTTLMMLPTSPQTVYAITAVLMFTRNEIPMYSAI